MKDKPWKRKLHELSTTFCKACGYCFDLKLCKSLTNKNIVLPAYLLYLRLQKRYFFTSTPVLYVCRYSFATSRHVCSVLSIDFVKKSRIECCFWSAQCIGTQARTSDFVKSWVFISSNVQWWYFIDRVVYCNILRSLKAAFVELEKAKFTGRTLFPMFTIITAGPYTHSKQSKAIHARSKLKVNCDTSWNW